MKRTLLATMLLTSIAALTACQQDAATDTSAAVAPPAADATLTAPPMSADPAAATSTEADAAAQANNPMVGGAPMFADRDIVTNAATSQDHTTLVAAVQAAGLADTLKGPGPFTVFAPTNAAFEKLPAGAVDGLLKPEMKADLTKVLTYHVVPGNVDAATLVQQIQAGGGTAKLTTVEGAELTAQLDGETVTLTDAKGDVARVTTADVRQSNGVIHVIDTVLMP
ncbi:putative surface protein with fasciclin (FAS1) repeats [Luteimonas sp. 3794]|nr:putative surface protein with fasciclin (FAS1) repeats [Luteimonas sp. 3794]